MNGTHKVTLTFTRLAFTMCACVCVVLAFLSNQFPETDTQKIVERNNKLAYTHKSERKSEMKGKKNAVNVCE